MGNQESEQKMGLRLARRAYVYNLMHVIFGVEPDCEILERAFNEQTVDTLDALEKECADRVDDCAQCCHNACIAVRKIIDLESRELVDEFQDDYSKLFVAPGDTYVRQWESSYIGKEGMVFQDSTLDVRSFYHDAGLKLVAEKRFPDDHLAAMMDYLGRLSERAYDEFADGDDKAVLVTLDVQTRFLHCHVLTWVDAFASKVVECDERGRYAAFAGLLAAFAHYDYAAVELMKRELGDNLI